MESLISKIKKIDIKLLKPHPKNKEIYGEENIKELADKIKTSNWISPLIINKSNIIISGHRRYLAALSLKITHLPFERVNFKNSNEELERLLLENEYREKTMMQKTQEGKLWEEIESKKAKERMILTQNNNSAKSAMDNVPQQVDKGATRDIIASKVGIGSGRTYERAKEVVNKIDELKQEGKKQDAEFLKTILNESVRGAQDIAGSNRLNEVSQELKDKVIKKETPVSNAIRDIKKNLGIAVENPKKIIKDEQENKSNTKICKQCGEEKNLNEFYESRTICKDCHNENSRKNRKPKDVYGNIIEIDKEKIKGMNIEAVMADVKDTNKNINIVDYDAVSMELGCNIDMFIQNISKYINMADIYKLENVDKDNKEKILKSIDDIENTMNKIKNILI